MASYPRSELLLCLCSGCGLMDKKYHFLKTLSVAFICEFWRVRKWFQKRMTLPGSHISNSLLFGRQQQTSIFGPELSIAEIFNLQLTIGRIHCPW